ncbi:hypothetical protein ACHAXS_010784 [Conticribra weissflogii]
MNNQTLLPLAIILFVFSSWFVFHYAKRSTSCLIILLSIVSFGLGSAAVALLPIDLSYASTSNSSDEFTDDDINNDTDGKDNEDDTDLSQINPTYLPWQITYWTTFFLAWLVLPITRETLLSGHFSLSQRLKDGITISVKGIFLMILMGAVAVVAMAIHLQSIRLVQTVLPVLMALGNTYGLVLVSLLLGNGLVNIPKRFWREACPAQELRRARIMICGAEEELFEAVWELEDVEKHIESVCRYAVGFNLGSVGSEEEEGGENENGTSLGIVGGETATAKATGCGLMLKCCNFRNCWRSCKCTRDEVTQFHQCLEELVRRKNETNELSAEQRPGRSANPSSPNHRNRTESENESDAMAQEAIQNMDVQYLVKLNAQLKRAQERAVSAQLRWNHLIERNHLFSALDEENSTSDTLVGASATAGNGASRRNFMQRLWVRHLRYHTFRVLAIITAVLSVFVLLSEVTLAAPLNLSPFSWVLHSLDHFDSGARILFQTCALIPLLYMSLCVYTCLFQMSLLGPNCLRGNRQSHGVALIFNAQYLVRLQFPLGYNYLLMLKYEITKCAFSDIMSDMSTIPFFGTSFSVYAPLLILAVCSFTLCDAYPKILHALGIEHEDAVMLGDAEDLESKMKEGMQLIQRDVERRGGSPDKHSLVRKGSGVRRNGNNRLFANEEASTAFV